MLKTIRMTLFSIALLLAAAALLYACILLRRGGNSTDTLVRAAMTVLRSEDMSFWVVHRCASTVLLEKKENSLLWGPREGMLAADVEIFYGFDPEKLSDDAFRRNGNKLVLRMPPVEPFRVHVDLKTMRFFSKVSTLRFLRDRLENADLRAELEQEFQTAAERFFQERNLVPDRDRLVRRMNEYVSPKLRRQGIELTFE